MIWDHVQIAAVTSAAEAAIAAADGHMLALRPVLQAVAEHRAPDEADRAALLAKRKVKTVDRHFISLATERCCLFCYKWRTQGDAVLSIALRAHVRHRNVSRTN